MKTMTPERLAELDAVMAKATAAFPITSRDTADYAEITFGSSQTQAMSMEPATLLAINGVFAAVPDLRALIDAQAATIAALQAFKDYVHERLDAAGVPTHPEGKHSAAGCRVGDRLDIALDAQAATIADLVGLALQYRDDLKYPPHPVGESYHRRVAAINAVLAKIGATQ